MKPLNPPLRRLALALLLFGVSLPALPQAAGRYLVEVVVFRQGGTTAALPANAAAPVITGDDVEPGIVATRRLGGAASRLKATGGFRVLGHAAWVQGPTGWNSRRGVAAARLGMTGVSGKVFFERGQYLHLGVDLVVEDGGQRFRISEVRRVKPDEIQYFDHPAVGVLAVVSAAPAGP